MFKKYCALLMLVVGLSIFSSMFSMEPDTTNNWTSNCSHAFKRTFGAATKTIVDNPICSTIGAYYLFFDRETIKANTFWSGAFGACLLGSFAKNLFAPRSKPKNCIVKTVVENPFFTFVAAHMLLFHRNLINQYPIETMIVGGNLLYNLSVNFNEQQKDDGLVDY